MTLRGALARGRVRSGQLHALTFPWTRPERGPLASRLVKLVTGPVVPASPGQALLVSVHDGAGRGELWRLSHAAERPANALPWGFEADAALGNARRIVHAVLPLLASTPAEPSGVWFPEQVYAPLGSELLDGRSFGASMLLGVASLLLGEPVPLDLAASAEVDADGRLRPVEGIDAKIRTVTANALGVRRLVVASGQRVGRRGVAAAKASGLVLREVASAEELVELAFAGSLRRAARRAFGTPAACIGKAEQLYHFALQTRPLVSWKAVRRTAERLEHALARCPRSPAIREASAKATFAERTAARHEGEALSLPWPSPRALSRLERTVRLRHLAHVLQSHTDGADSRVAGFVSAARRHCRRGREASPEDLILLGAIGRALARLRRYAEARAVLVEAVRGWLPFQPDEAGVPLSELFRVIGATKDLDALEGVERELFPVVLHAPRATAEKGDDDRSFLRLARGRARVLLGRAADGIADLSDDEFWSRARHHVRTARLRWLARAHAGLGHEVQARARREELARFARETRGGQDQLLLAALDAAREAGASRDVEACVRRLRRRYATDCGLILARAKAEEAAGVLADEFPY